MLNIYRSNSEDRLVEILAEIMTSASVEPTEPEWVCVQSNPMRTWLGQKLAERLGIWAGAKILFPRELVEDLIVRVLGDQTPDFTKFTEDNLTFAIFSTLPELVNQPEFQGPKNYLEMQQKGLKRFQFSQRIAKIFDAYTIYRPEVALGFEGSKTSDDWQGILFGALVAKLDSSHLARGAHEFLKAMGRDGFSNGPLPKRVFLFGIAHLPPLFLQILDALGHQIDVHLFISTPSREYFGHLRSGRPGKRIPLSLPNESQWEDGNPLLGSLGRLGRDFQQTIEDLCTYHEADCDLYVDPAEASRSTASRSTASERTLLEWVQSDILNLRDRHPRSPGEQSPIPIPRHDTSISIHSCHSPLRELEVVRHSLLSLFDDSAQCLIPEDVLIMAPDIHLYFPFIESVFAGEAEGPPAIPFSVCDVSPRQKSQVIAAFFKILELQESRTTLEEVFDILRMPPVRDGAGLSEQEIDIAYKWSLSAGIRWGINGRHREQHGQPGFEENTWRFGLQRLLVGYAMPEENLNLFAGVLPFDEIEGQAREILGKFAGFVNLLFHWIEELGGPHTLPQWNEKLAEMVQQIIAVSRENSRDHQALRAALGTLTSIAKTSKVQEKIDLQVMRAFLASKFEISRTSRGFLAGGVTFSSLRPMRNVPFKIICLLGMNQQHFPRNTRAPEFDDMAKNSRIGDRSPNLDDRYLFLQALLSAKERLIVTFVGQSNQDGSPLEPSHVVLELLDTLEAGFYLENEPRENEPTGVQYADLKSFIITEHPLSAFSPRYFGASADPRYFSYSREDCRGARELQKNPEPTRPYLTNPIPLDTTDPQILSLEDLISFFKLPCRYLARHRLGLELDTDTIVSSNREPIEPDPLDNYSLGSALLEQKLQREDSETLRAYFRAKGVLPLGQVGRAYFQDLSRHVDDLADVVFEHTGQTQPLSCDFQTTVDGAAVRTRVHGRIRNIWPLGRIEYRYGKITSKSLLELWIRHIFMHLSPSPTTPTTSTLIGRGEKETLAVARLRPIEEDPMVYFRDLVDIFWLGQTVPLGFFPESSFTYAKSICRENEQTNIREATKRALGKWRHSNDRLDPAVRLLHRHEDPLVAKQENNFSSLSVRVFEPLFFFLELLQQ